MTTRHPARRPFEPLEPMDSAPYLAPIEKPKGLRLKLLYRLLGWQFGKVPSWLRVFSARMPLAFTSWAGKAYKLEKKLQLSSDTARLVREHVDSLNSCSWCMDAGRWFVTTKKPHLLPKLDELHEYRTSPLFDDKERAALDFATELTETKHVSPATFALLQRHYSEREICEIVWLVASEHVSNLSNHGLNIRSDGLCQLTSRPKRPSAAIPAGGRR